MEIPYTIDQLKEATLEVVRANDFKACYIRPLVYRGYGSLGVNPFPNPGRRRVADAQRHQAVPR